MRFTYFIVKNTKQLSCNVLCYLNVVYNFSAKMDPLCVRYSQRPIIVELPLEIVMFVQSAVYNNQT